MTKQNNPKQNRENASLKKTDKSYADSYEFRQKNKSCIPFGILGGFFLSLLSYLRAVSADYRSVFFWVALLAVGIILLLIGLIYPLALYPVQQLVRKVAGLILRCVLTTMLGVLYLLYFIPVGLIMRRKRERFGFYSWKNVVPGKNSYLVDSAYTHSIDAEKNRRKNGAGTGKKIENVLFVLREYRLMLLLPILIFLLILGILFTFASSGIAEYFIYTLF